MADNPNTPVNNAVIQQIAKKMVKEHGFWFIPDQLEERLYANVMRLALQCFDMLLGNVRIKFMGHELVMDLRSTDIASS